MTIGRLPEACGAFGAKVLRYPRPRIVNTGCCPRLKTPNTQALHEAIILGQVNAEFLSLQEL